MLGSRHGLELLKLFAAQVAHLEHVGILPGILTRRLPRLPGSVSSLSGSTASSRLVGVVLIQVNEGREVVFDVFDLLMAHNMVRISGLVAPLIRLVVLLSFVGLVAVEEFQILSDLRFQVKQELVVGVAIGAFHVQDGHVLDLPGQLWGLRDLFRSLVCWVFVDLVNDFLNILQNVLGLNLFILLNQIEGLQLGLADSFVRDATAIQIVRPGELLDGQVLFRIVISLFLLGQLLAALVAIIILPFEVGLTRIKALKFAV